MSPYIVALRAITMTVFQRVYRPIVWTVGILLGVITITVQLLAWFHSPWWLLAFIIIVPAAAVFAAIAVLLWKVSTKLLPRPINHTERKQMTEFSDKIMRILELRATPLPVMAALITKDIIRGKKSNYVEGIIEDSKSLKSDFITITRLFEQ